MTGILTLLDQPRTLDVLARPTSAIISFFLTGTTTFANIYSDANLTIPAANPVVISSGQLFPTIYLDPKISYRRRINYGDGTTYDCDSFLTAQAKMHDQVNVKDFGVMGNGVVNDTAALQLVFSSGATRVYIPAGTYKITLSGLTLPSNIEIYGDGPDTILEGPDAAALLADVTGTGVLIDGETNVTIRNLCIKNGYKGIGIKAIGSNNLNFIDVTIEGFTDGMWIGEDANLKGCKNVKIIRPTIKNQMYWGVYIRALGVTNPSDFTRFITLDDGYFYNCNMAGFVVAEGTPEHITLSNTNFERCPVAQHFELCRKYTVINCKDYDTKKYPDQLPCNLEYPFPTLDAAPQLGWSQYHFGSSLGTTSSCTFEQTINHYASASSKCTDLKYTDTVALSWVYQGAGSTPDTNKNFFESHSWNNCTSNGVFIFQIETDPTNAYLRNFNIAQSECKIGAAGNSAGGSNVAVQIGRGIDFSFTNNSVRNGFLRVKSLGSVIITGNKFLVGTDRTQTILDGVNGAFATLSFLNFSGNHFTNAGGVVVGDNAVLIQNWSVARCDSLIQGSGNTNYIVRFKDSNRVELGRALLNNAITANYVESGVGLLVSW
jgi:hypothetical protein